jgi:hypothetical protein
MTQQAHVAIEQLGQFMKSLKSNGAQPQIQVLVSKQQQVLPIQQKQQTQIKKQTSQQS